MNLFATLLAAILLLQMIENSIAPPENPNASGVDQSEKSQGGLLSSLYTGSSQLMSQGLSYVTSPLQTIIKSNLQFIPPDMQPIFLNTLRTICDQVLPAPARQAVVHLIDKVLEEAKINPQKSAKPLKEHDTTDMLIYKLLSDTTDNPNHIDSMIPLGVNSEPMKLVIKSFMKSLKLVIDAYVERYTAYLEDSSIRIHEDLIEYERKI